MTAVLDAPAAHEHRCEVQDCTEVATRVAWWAKGTEYSRKVFVCFKHGAQSIAWGWHVEGIWE